MSAVIAVVCVIGMLAAWVAAASAARAEPETPAFQVAAEAPAKPAVNSSAVTTNRLARKESKPAAVRHTLKGKARDSRFTAGSRFKVALTAHPSLTKRAHKVTVQAAHLNKRGKRISTWFPLARATWASKSSGTHVMSVRAPRKPGGYALRTRVKSSTAQLGQRTATVATSSPQGVYLDQTEPSPTDEDNIEYFNLINFQGGVTATSDLVQTPYSLTISCPERESADIPSTEFDIRLETADGQFTTSCYDQKPIVLQKTDLDSNKFSFCIPRGWCTFHVLGMNSVTGTIYSQTTVQLPVTQSPLTEILDLESATMPIANNTIAACLIDQTCTLSESNVGELQLCESATSCTLPRTVVRRD